MFPRGKAIRHVRDRSQERGPCSADFAKLQMSRYSCNRPLPPSLYLITFIRGLKKSYDPFLGTIRSIIRSSRECKSLYAILDAMNNECGGVR